MASSIDATQGYHQVRGEAIEQTRYTNLKNIFNSAWLGFVVSYKARNTICAKLKHMNREDVISLGKRLVHSVLLNVLPDNIMFSGQL